MNAPWVEQALALVGRKTADLNNGRAREDVVSAAKGLGMGEGELVQRALAKDPSAYTQLVGALTVNETYFFRHPEHFDVLTARAEARRDAGRPFETAWSVGCATGEEPYSLALALLPFAPRIRVLASDVSPRALAAVRRGRYGPSSFRARKASSLPLLRPRGDEYEVAPALRDRVVTHELNLAHDAILPPALFSQRVDVIFCRNVLLYFPQPLVDQVIKALGQCLSEDGLLILGTLEGPREAPAGLERVGDATTSIFRRPPPRRAVPLSEPLPVRAPSLSLSLSTSDAFAPARARPSMSRLAQVARQDARRRADAGDLRGALVVLKPFSEDPDALALCATIHEELEEPREAELVWRRLLLHDPGHVSAHLHLLLISRRSGEARELQRWHHGLVRLLDGRPDAEEIDASGMRVAYVRAVLANLRLEASHP